MAEMKESLFTYLAQRHFDLMPAAVRARFDDYAKTGSFNGNMKSWLKEHMDPNGNNKVLPDLTTTITDIEDWKKLYMSCQKALQKMYKSKTYGTGYGSPYAPAVTGFIDRWFNTDGLKLFTQSKATSKTKTIFENLGVFLQNNSAKLKSVLVTSYLKDSVFNDTSYEKFCSDLQSDKFNDKQEFRDKVQSIIQYIQTHIEPGSPEVPEGWPFNVGFNMTGGAVDVTAQELKPILGLEPNPADNLEPEADKWYEISDLDPYRVNLFKQDYINFFDELLTNKTVREKFLEKVSDDSAISQALRDAIARTDYENKESDNYVPPMPEDEKNIIQIIQKWKNDTYENHFRRFFDHNRGARIFYSPHSQNIMKAFDKAGIKPTDGIDGILSKKGDAKLLSVINGNPQTKKHFDWFTKKMEAIKEEMPDAFEGALRNGDQLRKVVMRIITTTIPADKEKAKTALEVLSVAKYGLLCSRTFDKLKEATKDMSILSNKDLSLNNTKAVQDITKAIDAMAGFAIRSVGAAVTGVRNFIQHRRTKIGKDIHKYEDLNNAYKKWQEKDTAAKGRVATENAAYHVDAKLHDLDNPARPVGGDYETSVQINDATMGTKDTPGPLRAAITTAVNAGSTTVTLPGGGTEDLAKVQHDVAIYEEATRLKKLETDEGWRKANPDVISELVGYWDNLEDYSKTHSFTLGSMQVKRDNMLAGWNDEKSKAQKITKLWTSQYGTLRAA